MFRRIAKFFSSLIKPKSLEPIPVEPILHEPVEPEPVVPREKMLVSSYVLEIFETGNFVGGNDSYGRVTLIRGDRGRLTYGKHQASLTSGSLYEIIKNYVKANGHFAKELDPYIDLLKRQVNEVDTDYKLHRILRRAGSDPVMRQVQDKFFISNYTIPALRWYEELKCDFPLSFSIINDSITHGSWYDPKWGGIKGRTDNRFGELSKIGEKRWMGAYIDTRFEWLAGHANHALRNTIYRPRFFREMIARNNWNLDLPFNVHGVFVSKLIEHEQQTSMVPMFHRFIKLKHPKMVGEDVYFIETCLMKAGLLRAANLDAEFNAVDEQAVIQYQRSRKLAVDGIVGLETFETMNREFFS